MSVATGNELIKEPPMVDVANTPSPEVMRKVDPEDHFEVHFGIRSPVEPVTLGYVNSAPQVRPEIYREGLEDLKASIASEGLINPPVLASLDYDSLSEYLDLVNRTWKTSVHPSDFKMMDDGNFLIVVAGHRRHKAVSELAEDGGHDTFSVSMDAQVLRQPSIHEILSVQMAENVFVSPPSHREAVLIDEIFKTGLAAGRYESMADFERKSPLGITKISNAVHFLELPMVIREIVADDDNKELNYSKSLMLWPVIREYSAYLRRNPHLIPRQQLGNYDVPSNEQIGKAVEERMIRILNKAPGNIPWHMSDLKKHLRGLYGMWGTDMAEGDMLFEKRVHDDRKKEEAAELTEVTRFLSGAVNYCAIAVRVITTLPEKIADKTTSQQRRVAKRLGKVAEAALNAQAKINEHLDQRND